MTDLPICPVCNNIIADEGPIADSSSHDIHFDRTGFGFDSRCGEPFGDADHLTRNMFRVTCNDCITLSF